MNAGNGSSVSSSMMVALVLSPSSPRGKKFLSIFAINSNKLIFVNSIHSLLSKCPCIQHLELSSTLFLYDQHVVDFSLFLGNLVSINLSGCWHLTVTTYFSLVRNYPSLSEINMEGTSVGKETTIRRHFGVYP